MKKVLLGAFAALATLGLLGVTTSGYPQRASFQQIRTTGTVTEKLAISGDNTGIANVGYIAFRELNGGTRQGYIGQGDATAGMDVANEVANGNLNLVTNGTGTVNANGTPVATKAPEAAGGTFVGQLVSVQYKGGNTDRTSTAVLANDVTLAGLTIPAAGTYIIDSQLCFVGPVSGAGGIQFRYAFTGTTTGTFVGMHTGAANAVPVAQGGYLALNANNISFATITTATANDCIRFSHTLNATSAGTVALMWAQAASNVNATRLNAGSAVWIVRTG